MDKKKILEGGLGHNDNTTFAVFPLSTKGAHKLIVTLHDVDGGRYCDSVNAIFGTESLKTLRDTLDEYLEGVEVKEVEGSD